MTYVPVNNIMWCIKTIPIYKLLLLSFWFTRLMSPPGTTMKTSYIKIAHLHLCFFYYLLMSSKLSAFKISRQNEGVCTLYPNVLSACKTFVYPTQTNKNRGVLWVFVGDLVLPELSIINLCFLSVYCIKFEIRSFKNR